jgi:hypothetical protein
LQTKSIDSNAGTTEYLDNASGTLAWQKMQSEGHLSCLDVLVWTYNAGVARQGT